MSHIDMNWTEATKQNISTFAEGILLVPVNTGYVVLDSDCEINIAFDDQDSDGTDFTNSIRIQPKSIDPIRIPNRLAQANNGVLYLHIKQTVSAAAQYCRVLWL